jgi:hypothetical protein
MVEDDHSIARGIPRDALANLCDYTRRLVAINAGRREQIVGDLL